MINIFDSFMLSEEKPMKTLKSKLASIYILLVVMIGIVGIFSIINMYSLSKSINNLMVDNYKSINASRQMLEAVEDQNSLLYDYIYSDVSPDIDAFNSKSDLFYRWLNIEENNITENGERYYVNLVKTAYLKYQDALPVLQRIRDSSGISSSILYYNNNYHKYYISIRSALKSITAINENAMFNSKAHVTKSVKTSMYLLILLSIAAILAGFIIASYLTDKFMSPLYALKKNMMAVKEGYMHQEVLITSNDEIGALALEFNHMISRLQLFEKSTKGKLLEEKNKSLAIVKSISDPLIVLDTNFKVILLNHACEYFFDAKETDALNKHFLEIIRIGDVFDHIVQAYKTDEDKYIPNIISLNIGNKEFYFDTIVTKVRDENHIVAGVVVLFQNITKLKKLDKVKSEFVYMISHEFKTPLTSIMMGTSLLKDRSLGEFTEKQAELLATIEDDTERLSALVSNIIQLSRVESENDMFYFEKNSIYSIIKACVRTFYEQALNKNIDIHLDLDEMLPDVTVDTEKLSWVINNLISNSIKYTEPGGHITISGELLDNYIRITVKDNGIGIPDEYKNKVFDKFFRLDNDNDDIPGTGLGLTIAREIVETHKGKIWYESSAGKGACFVFTLPISD